MAIANRMLKDADEFEEFSEQQFIAAVNAIVAEGEGNAKPKQRRKRRTKAEIQAEAAAAEITGEKPKRRGRPKGSKNKTQVDTDESGRVYDPTVKAYVDDPDGEFDDAMPSEAATA